MELTIILLLISAFSLGYLKFYLDKIEKYSKVSLDKVYSSNKLREYYNLSENKTPADLGFKFEECFFFSEKDNLKLSAWFIPSEDKSSKKSIVFIHGRRSNRLFAMEYLEIIKKNNLNKKYSIFIPDMRNSGSSDKSRTYMGYKSADDVFYSLKFLKNNFNRNDVVLYGFSMGAMAISLSKNKYLDQLNHLGIKISNIILDSPLSNVKKILLNDAQKKKVPKPIFDIILFIFNLRIRNSMDKLSLNHLINGRIKTVVLQSKEDDITPLNILKEENIHNRNNVKVFLFDQGEHVKLYRYNLEKYEKIITGVIR